MTWRRTGAAAALVAALILAAPVRPAGAAPVITLTTPAEGAVLDAATVAVSGRAQAGSTLASFKDITLTLNGARLNVPCRESVCPFTWSPSLPANGRYELVVSATEQTLVLEGATSRLTRKFVVDAPPAKPVLDAPKITDARTVELSWSRNTEPDMLFYAVFRKDPAGTTFLPVGRIDQPPTGRAVTFTDATTTVNGGDYAYQVVAVRRGGTKPETASAPSSVRTATVPAPPTTTTAAPLPGAPAPAGVTTTTARPGAAGGVDLSGFLASRAQATPAPPTTILEPPDSGFAGSLPFGAALPAEDLEEGEAEAVVPSTERSTAAISLDSGRPLVPVAGGLILLLLAVHIRVLNQRLRPAGAGDIPIEEVRPAPVAAPNPAAAVLATSPGAEQGAASVYDASDDGWEDPWAPTSGNQPDDADNDADDEEEEAEPEPAPVAELEPEEAQFDLAPLFHPLGDAGAQDGLDRGLSGPGHDDLEVVEVISPTRRPLARAASR